MKAAAALLAVGLASVLAQHALGDDGPPADARPQVASQGSQAVHHYEYVFPDAEMDVYDMDDGHRLVEQKSLPGIDRIRGVAMSPAGHALYIAHGGDSGDQGTGSLLKYDLVDERVVWDRALDTGIDSPAVSRDGSRVFMPTGERSTGGAWAGIDTAGGDVVGRIDGGTSPHNTVVSVSGRHVYLGGRNNNYLRVADTATDRVVKRIGPLRSGVRPFTINGRETLAYTTATGFLGFQVSSIRTGRVLYTVTPGRRFKYDPSTFEPTAPSHGISLSPDERRLWVMDAPNNSVHVYDVSRVPQRPPRKVADVRLPHSMAGDESPCNLDCLRDGWIQHSRDGRFVYVGDSGDIISGRTYHPIGYLETLHNTRDHLEIDWR